MSKDGMSKDGRDSSPMHVILKAGVTIGINTVAVFKNSEQTFQIFDSHSRNLDGMPDSFGKCILVHIEGLENVVSYMQMYCPETGAVPFEMKSAHILISAGQTDMQHVQQDQKSD